MNSHICKNYVCPDFTSRPDFISELFKLMERVIYSSPKLSIIKVLFVNK